MTDTTIDLVRSIYQIREGFPPDSPEWWDCGRWAEHAMNSDPDTFVKITRPTVKGVATFTGDDLEILIRPFKEDAMKNDVIDWEFEEIEQRDPLRPARAVIHGIIAGTAGWVAGGWFVYWLLS